MSPDGPTPEVPLWVAGSGARVSNANLRDGVVLRHPGPWSATVLALLRYLEDIGFAGAPRVVGTGFADDGRETLSFIPGESPQPRPWTDDAVVEVGALLRALHDATVAFTPPADAIWRPWFGRELPGAEPVIGHCDVGPWNIIGQGGHPVALIDWEFAGPCDARWELAHAAWLNAHLFDDDIADRNGLGSTEIRARQLGLLLDGYRLPAESRRGFVDMMIELAIYSARDEALLGRLTEDSPAVDASGYPVAWAVVWRARSASWMLSHRGTLERAILG